MTTVTDRATQVVPTTRVHGLDALRAGALLLGILLHSLLPFVTGLPWLVSDSQSAVWLGIPVYLIHLFRMSLFMLLAGYFGRMVLQRRGAGSYLRDRVVRILLPFFAFWPIAVLSLGLLMVLNVAVNAVEMPTPPPSDSPWAAFSPGQLWFLVTLMQCVVIMIVARALAVLVLGPERSARLSATAGRLLSTPAGVVIAAIPYAIGLLLQGSVLGGVIAPTSILPEAPSLITYLGAFVVGWALHAQPDALGRVARWWPGHLVLAVVLSAVGLNQSHPTSTTPLLVAAAVMAVAGWTWVYALVGLSVRFLAKERPWIRYLADASYWMYLIHLPLLLAVEIPLVPLGWPIAVKLALTWVVVSAAMLVSYHLLVRSTPIGGWLNGHRYPLRLTRRR